MNVWILGILMGFQDLLIKKEEKLNFLHNFLGKGFVELSRILNLMLLSDGWDKNRSLIWVSSLWGRKLMNIDYWSVNQLFFEELFLLEDSFSVASLKFKAKNHKYLRFEVGMLESSELNFKMPK